MKPTSDWRSVIKVHPAADLFPMMSPAELKALGEDIKANGLYHEIQMLSGAVIDGRNRLDAMELVGLELRFPKRENGNRYTSQIWAEGRVIGHCRHNTPIDIPDPYAFVASANIHRRHLTADQKRDLIGQLLKARPERSNRATAKLAHVDDKTVASVRRGLEANAEIPNKTDRVEASGRKARGHKHRGANPTQPSAATAEGEDKLAEAKALLAKQTTDDDLGEFAAPPADIGAEFAAGILAGAALEEPPVAQRLHVLLHIIDDLAKLANGNKRRLAAVAKLVQAYDAVVTAFGHGDACLLQGKPTGQSLGGYAALFVQAMSVPHPV